MTFRPRDREPTCVHDRSTRFASKQPMSACRICKDSDELAKWVADWAAWRAENPGSPEAQFSWEATLT